MGQRTVKQLEQQMDDNRQIMAQRDKAIRLATNPDFKDLILDGFCRDEAARLIHLSTDVRVEKESRDDALAMAQASGYVKRFLSFLVQQGAVAQDAIPELEEALAEARAMEDMPDTEEVQDVDGDGYLMEGGN